MTSPDSKSGYQRHVNKSMLLTAMAWNTAPQTLEIAAFLYVD